MQKSIPFASAQKPKKDTPLLRPRVNRLLEEASGHCLVTVTAGTGYGKSQAVSHFLAGSGHTFFWLQLTGLDNYPTRFWDMFTAAMQSRDAALASEMRGMGFPDSLEKIYTFLRLFSAAVYDRGRCFLVLDDFHKIEDASIIHFVETLCFSGIENLTIILITRYPLQLDYSGLQTRNLIANIDAAALRFTPEETRDYYQHAGISFSKEELANIHTSTEGWPLAIYLVGLHRQKSGTLFNDPIDCTVPLLYNIIENELFSSYSPDVQAMFIKLSLMESVPLGLLQIICGNMYADIAVHLRQNMFINYNPQTQHYHFHRLLRRFLRDRRHLLSPEESNLTYLAIGDWYKDSGKRLEALVYYDKCHHHGRIWQIIRQYGSTGYTGDFAHFCIQLMDKFPPEFIEATPLVRVTRAHFLLHTGEIELAYRHILTLQDEYESLPSTPQRREILGEVYIQLAHLSLMRGSYAFADFYRKAAACLPHGSSVIHPGQSYVGNNTALILFSPAPGEMQRMIQTLFDVMPLAAQVMNGCGTGVEYLAAAEGALYQADYDKAEEYAHQTIGRAEAAHQYDIVFNALLILIRVHFIKGEYEATFHFLDHLRSYAGRVDENEIYGLADITAGWLYIHINQPGKVPGWLTTGAGASQNHMLLNVGKGRLVGAMVLLYNKEYYELLAKLDGLESLYKARGSSIFLLHVHIQRAICLHRLGDASGALASFVSAYNLAHGNNILTPFIEYDANMRSLLDAVRAAPGVMDSTWLDTLYAKTCAYSKKRALIEQEYARRNQVKKVTHTALTSREKEVLAALCQGLTREEIASGFGVSVNTIKTSLKNIFSKLGAINRADAIRIAIDNHILE